MKRNLAVLALLAANILSGINTPVIHFAIQSMPPFLFGFLRVGIACLVIVPTALILRKRRPKRKQHIARRDLGLMALGSWLILGGANLLFYIGMQHTSSVNASIIILLWPILYFLGSLRFLKERFNRRTFAGIGLAFGGALLAVVAPMSGNLSLSSAGLIGSLLVLACVLVDIVGTVINKKTLERVHPLDLLAVGLFVSTIYYAALAAPYFGQLGVLANPNVLKSVLYGALAVGCAGYWLGNYGLQVATAADVSITNYLQPIVAIFVATVFFHESFTPIVALGTAAVFAGLYLVEARKIRHIHIHGVHR